MTDPSNPTDPARLDALAADLAERAAEHDRDGSFPFENFDLLGEAGLLRLTVPIELGGFGRGLVDVVRAVGAVARGDASTALVFSMQCLQHAGLARGNRWPREIYELVARDAVERGGLINALRVEPELGTPARGGLPATTAERVAGGWRLNGHKIYATGIPILRWLNVWARTAEAEPCVGSFLVPRDTPGVRVVETWDHMGMRATGSHDVLFEDAIVPVDHAVDVRPPAEWPRPTPLAAAWTPLVLSALYDGVARSARDWLVWYLGERKPSNLGASLATLPRFQSAVGEIDSRLITNRRVLLGAAAEVDAGSPPSVAESGQIKRVVTTNAIDAVASAIALVGNPGLSRRNPLERHYRDVLCSRIHTPQDDTILLTAGRAALGV